MYIDFKLSPVVVQYLRYYMREDKEFVFSFGSQSIHYDFIRNLLEEKPIRVKVEESPELIDVKFKINECDYLKKLDLRSRMFWVPPAKQKFFNDTMHASIISEYYAFVTGYMTNNSLNGRKEPAVIVSSVSDKYNIEGRFRSELIERLENNHDNKRLRLKVPIESFKRKFGFTEELFPYETAKKRYYRSVNRPEVNKERVKGLIFRREKNIADGCPDSSEEINNKELNLNQLGFFDTDNQGDNRKQA